MASNIIAAVLVLGILGAVFGLVLAVASKEGPPGGGNSGPSGRGKLRRLRLPGLRRLRGCDCGR